MQQLVSDQDKKVNSSRSVYLLKSLRKAFSPANDNRDIFLHKNHFLLLGWYILAENTTDGIETFYLLAFKFCSNLRIDKMKTCMLLWFQNENLC